MLWRQWERASGGPRCTGTHVLLHRGWMRWALLRCFPVTGHVFPKSVGFILCVQFESRLSMMEGDKYNFFCSKWGEVQTYQLVQLKKTNYSNTCNSLLVCYWLNVSLWFWQTSCHLTIQHRSSLTSAPTYFPSKDGDGLCRIPTG